MLRNERLINKNFRLDVITVVGLYLQFDLLSIDIAKITSYGNFIHRIIYGNERCCLNLTRRGVIREVIEPSKVLNESKNFK